MPKTGNHLPTHGDGSFFMSKKLKRTAAFFCAAGFLFFGCAAPKGGDAASGKPIVAVSIVPEATFAREVCGNRARIVTLVPPGASPETYELSPRQAEEFSSAGVFFAIGVPAEQVSILPRAPKGMRVVRLQDAVAEAYPDRVFESGSRDPHIWLSPKRASVMVRAMAREMALLDPAHQAEYAAAAAASEKRLRALDAQLREILAAVPGGTFLVFHPAFGYFADDYGLNMAALEQEGKESTARHTQEMVNLAGKNGAKTIFYQAETDGKQAMAFAEEIGGNAVELAPLSGDYENNLIKMARAIAGAARTAGE